LEEFAPAAHQLSVDIIVPVYNEEEAAVDFHLRLRQALDSLPYHFSIIYVNDGSTDRTIETLEKIANQDTRVSIVELSRNFGHQAALTAGLDLAQADYVITMDGDGQHPPALIGEMLQLAQSGYDIVLTQRTEEKGRSNFKKWTSNLFYRLINRIGDTQILPGFCRFPFSLKAGDRSAVQHARIPPAFAGNGRLDRIPVHYFALPTARAHSWYIKILPPKNASPGTETPSFPFRLCRCISVFPLGLFFCCWL
jgi:glycosyltransferase involved in cell wall biosynthesis